MQIPVFMISEVSTVVNVHIPDNTYDEMSSHTDPAVLHEHLANEAAGLAPSVGYGGAEFDAVEEWDAISFTDPDGNHVEMVTSQLASDQRIRQIASRRLRALQQIRSILEEHSFDSEADYAVRDRALNLIADNIADNQ